MPLPAFRGGFHEGWRQTALAASAEASPHRKSSQIVKVELFVWFCRLFHCHLCNSRHAQWKVVEYLKSEAFHLSARLFGATICTWCSISAGVRFFFCCLRLNHATRIPVSLIFRGLLCVAFCASHVPVFTANNHEFRNTTHCKGPWANNDYDGQLGDDWSASPENHFSSRWANVLYFSASSPHALHNSAVKDFTPLSSSLNSYQTRFRGFWSDQSFYFHLPWSSLTTLSCFICLWTFYF
jgi:hypothetical protein